MTAIVVQAHCKYCGMQFMQEAGTFDAAIVIMSGKQCRSTPDMIHRFSDIVVCGVGVRSQ